MSLSPPKLTSLSTQTLTLILETQRFPSTSNNAQIFSNLKQLRAGILEYEAVNGKTGATQDVAGQYERMRGMMGSVEGLDSLQEPPKEQPETSKEDDGSSDDFDHHRTTAFTPYSDNPDVERGQSNEEMLQMQQQMMDEQDTHLTHLSSSLHRTHHLSLAINDELEDHTLLLDGLDDSLGRTDTRMATARRRLDRVADGVKGNASTVTIGVLIFVLLVLIVVFKT
ncbi:hypothetical protein BDV98DRAFT_564622 [Pterulicium gracile]|uniref:t-SNARE coiled-coil homology domain-containing protein n=1 Tax=Pterulicium gracile TaxID=1884261 RepID=A0A5C3QT36_9AGAR|nr:hypothetical protein BDV98DRAFT_564622 [Pterula gracilis]